MLSCSPGPALAIKSLRTHPEDRTAKGVTTKSLHIINSLTKTYTKFPIIGTRPPFRMGAPSAQPVRSGAGFDHSIVKRRACDECRNEPPWSSFVFFPELSTNTCQGLASSHVPKNQMGAVDVSETVWSATIHPRSRWADRRNRAAPKDTLRLRRPRRLHLHMHLLLFNRRKSWQCPTLP